MKLEHSCIHHAHQLQQILQIIEKFTKYKRTGIANQRNIARKYTTQDHQVIKMPPYQMSDIDKIFVLLHKEMCFDIKSDTKELIRKLKLRDFGELNIMMKV